MAENADFFTNLRRCIDYSYRELEPFRRNRRWALEQYVGHNYSDHGSPDRVPINWIEMAVETYARLMISGTPAASVTTQHSVLRPSALELEEALNHWSRRQGLLESLKEIVKDALFGIGVAKIGLDDEDEHSLRDGSQYYVSSVSLTNFFIDTAANRRRDVLFVGDRYRRTMRYVQEHPEFDKEVVRTVQRAGRHMSSGQWSDERGEDLATGPKDLDETLEPMVDLQDVYVPQDNRLITMAVDGAEGPLWEREYVGPPGGPYAFLAFEEVPENIMPLPPVALWADIHDLANRLFRKLGRQAERQKTILAVQGKDQEDGHTVTTSNDGQAVSVQNPEGFKEIRFGGADQGGLSFLMNLRNQFNQVSGNVEMLGGIAPTSDTLGQDRMLNENASARVGMMQEATVEFVRDVMSRVGWYLWSDPFIHLPLIRRIPGTDIEVPVEFSAMTHEGEYYEYNLDVQPYSLRTPTPSERMSVIDQIVTQVIMPMMPMLAEQGIGLDFEAYLKLQAKYRGIPELESLLVFQAPRHPEPGPTKPPPRGPKSNAPRKYIRENVSRGMTREAQDQQMAMRMASGVGDSGGIGRPNGT